jgi:hypothetical protein
MRPCLPGHVPACAPRPLGSALGALRLALVLLCACRAQGAAAETDARAPIGARTAPLLVGMAAVARQPAALLEPVFMPPADPPERRAMTPPPRPGEQATPSGHAVGAPADEAWPERIE